MPDNDLWEGIYNERKRLILRLRLFLVRQRICRLDIGLLSPVSCNEVNLTGNSSGLSGLVLLIGLDNPNINRAFPNNQFIVNDVFHDVGHFLLTEANTRIA